jgi:hypothetical protein
MGVVARLERVDERDCLFYLQIVPWYVVLNVQTNGNKVLLGRPGRYFIKKRYRSKLRCERNLAVSHSNASLERVLNRMALVERYAVLVVVESNRSKTLLWNYSPLKVTNRKGTQGKHFNPQKGTQRCFNTF